MRMLERFEVVLDVAIDDAARMNEVRASVINLAGRDTPEESLGLSAFLLAEKVSELIVNGFLRMLDLANLARARLEIAYDHVELAAFNSAHKLTYYHK